MGVALPFLLYYLTCVTYSKSFPQPRSDSANILVGKSRKKWYNISHRLTETARISREGGRFVSLIPISWGRRNPERSTFPSRLGQAGLRHLLPTVSILHMPPLQAPAPPPKTQESAQSLPAKWGPCKVRNGNSDTMQPSS